MDVTYDADTDTMQAHTRRYERERDLYVPERVDLWTPTDAHDARLARVFADLGQDPRAAMHALTDH